MAESVQVLEARAMRERFCFEPIATWLSVKKARPCFCTDGACAMEAASGLRLNELDVGCVR
jgi:hypothetical protein